MEKALTKLGSFTISRKAKQELSAIGDDISVSALLAAISPFRHRLSAQSVILVCTFYLLVEAALHSSPSCFTRSKYYWFSGVVKEKNPSSIELGRRNSRPISTLDESLYVQQHHMPKLTALPAAFFEHGGGEGKMGLRNAQRYSCSVPFHFVALKI
jgi:hypothetical protein